MAGMRDIIFLVVLDKVAVNHLFTGLSIGCVPIVIFRWILFKRPLLLVENRVAVRINPVSVLRRRVATNAVDFEIGGNILLWFVDAVKTPAPATAPIWASGKRVFSVLDHHKPLN